MAPALLARSGVLLLTTALLASCGSAGDTTESAAIPQDTFIKPIVREPLTEADLAGMPMSQLSLELPWTRNRISRDPAPGAPVSDIQSADLESHDGFDRVTFAMGDPMNLPGYTIAFADDGASVQCGGTETAVPEGSVMITFAPARGHSGSDVWVTTGMRDAPASRISRAGVLCDDDDSLTWVAELAQGDQVRVLELRDPVRVALDMR